MKLCLLLLSFLSFVASPAWSKCDRTFTLGFNGPAVSKDKIKIETISTSILSELKNRVGCNFEQINLPSNKGREELRFNRIDLFGIAFANETDKNFSYPITIYSAKRMLLVNKSVYVPGAKVEDYLRNPKIKFGAISGGMLILQKELQPLQKENRVLFDPFPDGVLQLLYTEKVQAAFMTNTFLRLHEKQFPVKSKVEMIFDGTKADLSLFISKRRVTKSERELFQKAINEMRKDGTLRRILLKYITEDDLKNYYVF
jgi:ABC-type amino acid transport substrate-binding protein